MGVHHWNNTNLTGNPQNTTLLKRIAMALRKGNVVTAVGLSAKLQKN